MFVVSKNPFAGHVIRCIVALLGARGAFSFFKVFFSYMAFYFADAYGAGGPLGRYFPPHFLEVPVLLEALRLARWGDVCDFLCGLLQSGEVCDGMCASHLVGFFGNCGSDGFGTLAVGGYV